MADTAGINHLGLAVKNLDDSKAFFIEGLGWTESGLDPTYPRTAVSDDTFNTVASRSQRRDHRF